MRRNAGLCGAIPLGSPREMGPGHRSTTGCCLSSTTSTHFTGMISELHACPHRRDSLAQRRRGAEGPNPFSPRLSLSARDFFQSSRQMAQPPCADGFPLPNVNDVVPYSPGLCGSPHYPGFRPHRVPYPARGCAVRARRGGAILKGGMGWGSLVQMQRPSSRNCQVTQSPKNPYHPFDPSAQPFQGC